MSQPIAFCDVKGRERRFQRPFLFPCRKKKWFLESKEKGASVRVEWSQIGIRRPGFTPPLRTSPVYGRLPRWNRGKLWSYPTFFRRLRGWVLGRGAADCIPVIAAWVNLAFPLGEGGGVSRRMRGNVGHQPDFPLISRLRRQLPLRGSQRADAIRPKRGEGFTRTGR